MAREQTEAAKYIGDRLAELEREARGAKLETLAYLVQCARLEAHHHAGRNAG